MHVTWVDLVDSTHLAAAFSCDTVDQIIGLLLCSLPEADKPSLANPVALDWATAVDRHRHEVHSSTQVRKHHEKGMPIHSNGSPGSECSWGTRHWRAGSVKGRTGEKRRRGEESGNG